MSVDLSAVPANEMAIKLRHAKTNAKLKRTPFNLEQAITVAFVEMLDLNGELSAYAVMGNLAEAFAEEKGWGTDHPSNESAAHYAVGAAVEMLVNSTLGSLSAKEIAARIVSELRDMELID